MKLIIANGNCRLFGIDFDRTTTEISDEKYDEIKDSNYFNRGVLKLYEAPQKKVKKEKIDIKKKEQFDAAKKYMADKKKKETEKTVVAKKKEVVLPPKEVSDYKKERCSAIKKNGTQCKNGAFQNGLCNTHFRLEFPDEWKELKEGK